MSQIPPDWLAREARLRALGPLVREVADERLIQFYFELLDVGEPEIAIEAIAEQLTPDPADPRVAKLATSLLAEADHLRDEYFVTKLRQLAAT